MKEAGVRTKDERLLEGLGRYCRSVGRLASDVETSTIVDLRR